MHRWPLVVALGLMAVELWFLLWPNERGPGSRPRFRLGILAAGHPGCDGRSRQSQLDTSRLSIQAEADLDLAAVLAVSAYQCMDYAEQHLPCASVSTPGHSGTRV